MACVGALRTFGAPAPLTLVVRRLKPQQIAKMDPNGKEIFKYFLISSGKQLKRSEGIIEVAASSGSGELEDVCRSLVANIHSVHRTLSIPYNYTESEFRSIHWQRIHTSERIRSLMLEDTEKRDEIALANARRAFKEFMEAEAATTVADQIVERLLRLSQDEESRLAAQELSRQGIVLTWSAIEVFARDVFVLLLNNNPRLSQSLLAEPGNRKRFQSERIDWQTLESYDFNLSNQIGSFLAARADLSNVPAIRSAYSALFPAAKNLHSTLSNPILWQISQKRHLLVHKRGVIDKQFIEATNSNLNIGSNLLILPAEVEEAIDIAIEFGNQLAIEASNSIRSHASTPPDIFPPQPGA
jgi:hypothetical protein